MEGPAELRGVHGIVTLPIPAAERGKGKVLVQIKGRTVEYMARSRLAKEDIALRAQVLVIGLEGGIAEVVADEGERFP